MPHKRINGYGQSTPHTPSPEQLRAARDSSVPDLIAPDLKILFCGINPSLYTAAVGHHFARPGNRFWPALYGAGLIDQPLTPYDEKELLKRGLGITNLVNRATASESELSAEEILRGGQELAAKVELFQPRTVAVLGLGAYRRAFGRPQARSGKQSERLAGAALWVLPNPSGLNANHQLPDFIRLFRELLEDANREAYGVRS